MHDVLFRGHLAARPSSTQTSDKYYDIARNMTGVLSESSWRDPKAPNVQSLFATFCRRRSGQGVERQHVETGHDDFRITIGTDDEAEDGGEGHMELVYRRPAPSGTTTQGVVAGSVAGRADEERVEKLATAWEVYSREQEGVSEVLVVWVLERGVDAKKVEESIERVEGDALDRVRVLREYSKTDRKQALLRDWTRLRRRLLLL